MAFYPDELSPIDRISSFGNSTDLHDINPLKNRRQWKSLVLGKKDMAINNFATIAEEKEDEISSEENAADGPPNKQDPHFTETNCGIVRNKKITFAKPRKYITSRVSPGEKEFPPENLFSLPESFTDDSTPEKKTYWPPGTALGHRILRDPVVPSGPKPACLDPPPTTRDHVSFEPPMDAPITPASWQKRRLERELTETLPPPTSKSEDKKKSPQNVKCGSTAITARKNIKPSTTPGKNDGKRKKESNTRTQDRQNQNQTQNQVSKFRKKSPNLPKRSQRGEEKPKTSLNMKDVVNVYKNLTYGSEQEIKSFVENLSFVKDEAKIERNKNLLSVMNLKVLENKIKNFAKITSGKKQDRSTSHPKKSKQSKPNNKRNRKPHFERLARQKVLKVPATTLNPRTTPQKPQKTKFDKATEEKQPWKYVGMQSILDKTYLVYPAYPPSVNLKKVANKSKGRTPPKDSPAPQKNKKEDPTVQNTSHPTRGRPKTEHSNAKASTTKKEPTPAVPITGKTAKRPSATTVCNVEFSPSGGSRMGTPRGSELERADGSLLVYLHGTKAINVKSPYSDRQFSRVKFFRRDARGVPLIKGLVQKIVCRNSPKVAVKNVSLPDKLTGNKSVDLFDFEEDIRNINDFLRSQDTLNRRQNQVHQGQRKHRLSCSKDPDKDDRAENRCQSRVWQNGHCHRPPHGGISWNDNISPDTLVNEISQNIQHLQYLPNTEENRKLIGKFFDDLDERIEASKGNHLSHGNFTSFDDPSWSIPILGY